MIIYGGAMVVQSENKLFQMFGWLGVWSSWNYSHLSFQLSWSWSWSWSWAWQQWSNPLWKLFWACWPTRSTSGNGPAILSRFTAHRNALAGVIHTGIARGHHGNPASSIHLDKLYAIPVLMSDLATLVLTEAEIKMIDQHQKETLRCLLRLQPFLY